MKKTLLLSLAINLALFATVLYLTLEKETTAKPPAVQVDHVQNMWSDGRVLHVQFGRFDTKSGVVHSSAVANLELTPLAANELSNGIATMRQQGPAPAKQQRPASSL